MKNHLNFKIIEKPSSKGQQIINKSKTELIAVLSLNPTVKRNPLFTLKKHPLAREAIRPHA
jgi:hypothetical protein